MRSRKRLRRKVLGPVVLAMAVLVTPASASADAVTDWNIHAGTAIVDTARQFPGPALISYAMVQGAVYDAVNAIERTHEPYLLDAPADPASSVDAAAATAAYRVLADLFPEQRSTLDAQYADSLAAISDGTAKQGGIDAGQRAAAAILTARANDGRNGPLTWVPTTEIGKWRPVPPAFMSWGDAWAGAVVPFLPGAGDLSSDGPPPLGSRRYAKEFDEVKEIGSLTSPTRTPEQTDIALFHNDFVDQFDRVMRDVAVNQGLDSADTARLLAMGHLAEADAIIACYNDKYRWNSWRPITAIREAGIDGNPQTQPDPGWQPLVVNYQAGFPEHPSGHACVAAALAHTLRHFFGTDDVAFSTFGLLSGSSRSFSGFTQYLSEVLDARVWAGVHFRTGDVAGATIGRKVAKHLARTAFRRAHVR